MIWCFSICCETFGEFLRWLRSRGSQRDEAAARGRIELVFRAAAVTASLVLTAAIRRPGCERRETRMVDQIVKSQRRDHA